MSSDAADGGVEFIVAPTEPRELKAIASDINMFPEARGCDVCWFANGEIWGVQRKEIKDFIQSVGDGRLAREISQMQGMPLPLVLIEGRITYDTQGNLLLSGYGQQFTMAQFRGMLWSVRHEGVHIDFTGSTRDTVEYVQMLAKWSTKKRHSSIMTRPGPVSQWGRVSHEGFAVHIMQGFDGLGLEKARSIFKHFGRLPLRLDVTEAELMEVAGIGKGLARKIADQLRHTDGEGV